MNRAILSLRSLLIVTSLLIQLGQPIPALAKVAAQADPPTDGGALRSAVAQLAQAAQRLQAWVGGDALVQSAASGVVQLDSIAAIVAVAEPATVPLPVDQPAWLAYVPLDARAVMLTDWARWREIEMYPTRFDDDPALARILLTDEFTDLPLSQHLQSQAVQTLFGDFRAAWGWDVTDLAWELTVNPRDGGPFQVLKFQPEFAFTQLLERFDELGYARDVQNGVSYYVIDFMTLERSPETLGYANPAFNGYGRNLFNLFVLPEEELLFVYGLFSHAEALDWYVTGQTIGQSAPLTEAEIMKLLAAQGIEIDLSGTRNAPVPVIDEEQEAALLQALLARLYADAARDTVAGLPDAVALTLWLDVGICNALMPDAAMDLLSATMSSGKAPTEEAIVALRAELEGLQAAMPVSPYLALGTAVTREQQQIVSTVVMHYTDGTLAAADRSIRQELLTAPPPFLVERSTADSFTLLDATVVQRNLIFQLGWAGGPTDSIVGKVYNRNLLFAACP